MPGAGLEAGEDHEEAARREVWEETEMSDIRRCPHCSVRLASTRNLPPR